MCVSLPHTFMMKISYKRRWENRSIVSSRCGINSDVLKQGKNPLDYSWSAYHEKVWLKIVVCKSVKFESNECIWKKSLGIVAVSKWAVKRMGCEGRLAHSQAKGFNCTRNFITFFSSTLSPDSLKFSHQI